MELQLLPMAGLVIDFSGNSVCSGVMVYAINRSKADSYFYLVCSTPFISLFTKMKPNFRLSRRCIRCSCLPYNQFECRYVAAQFGDYRNKLGVSNEVTSLYFRWALPL